jgi:hypothetical protein
MPRAWQSISWASSSPTDQPCASSRRVTPLQARPCRHCAPLPVAGSRRCWVQGRMPPMPTICTWTCSNMGQATVIASASSIPIVSCCRHTRHSWDRKVCSGTKSAFKRGRMKVSGSRSCGPCAVQRTAKRFWCRLGGFCLLLPVTPPCKNDDAGLQLQENCKTPAGYGFNVVSAGARTQDSPIKNQMPCFAQHGSPFGQELSILPFEIVIA